MFAGSFHGTHFRFARLRVAANPPTKQAYAHWKLAGASHAGWYLVLLEVLLLFLSLRYLYPDAGRALTANESNVAEDI